MLDEGCGEASEVGVMRLIQVEKAGALGSGPCRHIAEPGDHGQPLGAGMIHDEIGVGPVEAPLLRLRIGPGEIFDDPRSAHLAHHLQRALDLPFLDLVGQPRVHTDLGIRRHHRLLPADRDEWATPRTEHDEEPERAPGHVPPSRSRGRCIRAPFWNAGRMLTNAPDSRARRCPAVGSDYAPGYPGFSLRVHLRSSPSRAGVDANSRTGSAASDRARRAAPRRTDSGRRSVW